ncbi:HK97 family phage prohead protease [Tautonia plasticadhaerens]|uniref:Caudovirus prohead protease n=1 Tax=Tautonia plasticadhaerens TaxID=2527974 RepID=A0A518GZL4_9BACT|nr:HK97 family phage prohead protease [Tautonia plasticadhaerens]QDV34025.1 Caudovirus prohead protease [Tautonia plasticadhaerens]
MSDVETRCLVLPDAEVRMAERDGRPMIVGRAIRYGSLSRELRSDRGRFRERFAPGAFTRSLQSGADVRALINHDKNLVMGRNVAGTLRLFDDPDELRFEIDPPDTTWSRDYLVSIARGDMGGVSFRFYKRRDDWERDPADGVEIRTVTEAAIDDVSIVTYPAYEDTSAALRSLDEFRRSQPAGTPLRARAARLTRLAEADS